MKIEKDRQRIGFIGLGVMGASMAGHILDAGWRLHVYTRTRKSADELVGRGAVWEESVAALARKCDVIISIVGMPEDVASVYLGGNGIVSHARPGTIAIDMTTSSPELAVRIFEKALEKKIHALDAPVSGGDIGARNAALSIMAGGAPEVFEAVQPILGIMGKNIVLQGPAGAGQQTKMANQIAIASTMIGVCEALSYAVKNGLNPERVLESIGQGAAGSWSLNQLGPRMIQGDFDPGFYIRHFIKDMNIAAADAERNGQELPGLALARSLYTKLDQEGKSHLGTQALFQIFQ